MGRNSLYKLLVYWEYMEGLYSFSGRSSRIISANPGFKVGRLKRSKLMLV